MDWQLWARGAFEKRTRKIDEPIPHQCLYRYEYFAEEGCTGVCA